jgi:nucleoside-diphosphate-sugar epimerase
LQSVVITGASGFIGRNLIEHLHNHENFKLKLLVRRNRNIARLKQLNCVAIEGDLLRPKTFESLFDPGCTVVNLAYMTFKPKHENMMAVSNLADVCARANIKRLIHCSTAVVVGDMVDEEITEESRCNPRSEYEIVKHEIERLLRNKADNHYEFTILRPTAVFGRGGKNLVKLADSLIGGNKIVNYFKSCLYYKRKMNLVNVDNVVSAIVFLIGADKRVDKEIFIISDDENTLNNYRDVEKFLLKKFEYKDYLLSPFPAPLSLLKLLLKFAGKTNTNPKRVYLTQKLLNAGFQKSVSFEQGLETFAEWYIREYKSTTTIQ